MRISAALALLFISYLIYVLLQFSGTSAVPARAVATPVAAPARSNSDVLHPAVKPYVPVMSEKVRAAADSSAISPVGL